MTVEELKDLIPYDADNAKIIIATESETYGTGSDIVNVLRDEINNEVILVAERKAGTMR